MISKSYRSIALLNCLDKIAKKMIANRLAYWTQKSDLLDENQMNDRKNRSAIDIVMLLTHDIQKVFEKKEILSWVLLDVKEAFDHVLKTQLLNVMRQLKLSSQIIRWTQSFMKNRKVSLLFDDNKSDFYDIESDISQRSSILSILFSIYVRKIHPEIRLQMTKS